MFLKDDIPLKITLILFIVDLEKQDLSYLTQLIEDKTEIFKYLQSKRK